MDIREDIMKLAEDTNSVETDTNTDNMNYTQYDEYQARKRAEEAVVQETNRAREDYNRSNNLAKELNDTKSIVARIAKEKEDLKREIEELKGHVNSVKDSDYQRGLKETMNQIEMEKKQIMDNPVLSKYYNDQEVFDNLKKNYTIGKILTPTEQLAILKFEQLAKENEELKSKLNNRGILLNRPIGKISSTPIDNEDDLADMQGEPYEIYKAKQKQIQLKKLEKMGI